MQGNALTYFVFFFSSRRPHTRFSRDWSSDVCSSDLNREVLNRDGVRIRQLDLPKVTAAAAAERQEVLRSAQRDVALVVSFDDEADLRRTQEERLGLVRSGLTIARGATERLQTAHAAHEDHAARLVAEGKPVPMAVQ